MTGWERSRILDWAMVATAGVLSAALITSVMLGIGPPGAYVPGCASMSALIAAGSVGAPTPEAAFELWLAEGAWPSTPRFGWTAVHRDGSILMINGGRSVNILDLRGGGGSGWAVNEVNCY